MHVLKQCTCDSVAGQMEILQEERGLPDGEREEWSGWASGVESRSPENTLVRAFKMWTE